MNHSQPPNPTVTYAIRNIDRELKDRFVGLCKMKGTSAKNVITAFMRAFIKTEGK